MDPMTPPNTVNFLIVGYIVLLGGLLVYLVSLRIRYRQVQVDKQFLEELRRTTARREEY